MKRPALLGMMASATVIGGAICISSGNRGAVAVGEGMILIAAAMALWAIIESFR